MSSSLTQLKPEFLVGSSEKEREPDDFYKTPAFATLALLGREVFCGRVWEPACGDGAISRLLEGCGKTTKVISTDLVDRGFGAAPIDFLTECRDVDHIITNPPFSLAQKFVEHALECVSGKVAMLLKLNFLETIKRKSLFERTPLRTVYVFSMRLSFDRGNTPGGGAGLLAYAWFVWEQGYKGKPTIEWI